MSIHPKKALLSKLYEKHLEKQRIEFEKQYKEKEISRPLPSMQYCLRTVLPFQVALVFVLPFSSFELFVFPQAKIENKLCFGTPRFFELWKNSSVL